MQSYSLPVSFPNGGGKLGRIFTACFEAIGGETNRDVVWYRKERPTKVSRNSFFEMFVWAVWVSGMRRKSAETFLDRAASLGFKWDYAEIASWDSPTWGRFLTKLHGSPCPGRAKAKWEAVRLVAQKLGQFSTEGDFRGTFFDGKSISSALGSSDVQRLSGLRLPFVRIPNAQFIIRNMGGEAVKCDRWVNSFLEYYRIGLVALEARIQQLGIPLGLFDFVLWAYCEENVRKTSHFPKHFERLYGKSL